MLRAISVVLSLAVLAGILGGCTLKYTVDEPAVSRFSYQNVDKKPLVMKIVDQRDDKNYFAGVSGLKRLTLVLENVEDPMAWLSTELEREFAARGVPLRMAGKDAAGPADVTLTVKKYQIANYRASGFSAWEAYHVFLGQVTMGEKSCTIPAFFFNSKIPVWSMKEVAKPCLSDPASILVKEIASKVNRCVFNYAVSDADVEKMAASALATVKPDTEQACFPSIELGGTNNPAALKTLQKIADNEDSFVHNCAVSAIGTLGAGDQFDYLSGKFAQFSGNDKVIPLKSIGDIGSSQAEAFIRKVKEDKLYTDENGVRFCVDLYLAR